MSDLRNLLEKMDAMTAAEKKPTGPRWPGYLKGTDNAKKIRNKMVGDGAAESVEESESFLKELGQLINSNPVKRDLFQEWQEYKLAEQDYEKHSLDRDPDDPENPHKWIITVPGTNGPVVLDRYSGPWQDWIEDFTGRPAPRDPMVDQMYDQLKQNFENPGPAPKSPPIPVPDVPTDRDTIIPGQDNTDYFRGRPVKKSLPPQYFRGRGDPRISENVQEDNDSEEGEKVTVRMKRPVGSDAYDKVRFIHIYPDGREELVPIGSYYHDKWYRTFTGKETPITQELIKGIQSPVKRGKEFMPKEPDTIQDIKVPGQDKGRYHAPLPNWKETPPITEYGAPGSGIGNDTARNPAEEFAKGQERKAAKQQIQGQIAQLVAQLQAARAQLADLNQQFPQGANPVEKTMAMQQMSAQKTQIKKQIEDLTAQIAALRQQAV